MLRDQYDGPIPQPKSLVLAYTLWLLLGLLGFHRFYLGHHLLGILYALTLGLAGIGWLVDLFLLPSAVREVNEEIEDAYLLSREALEDRIEDLEDQVAYLSRKQAGE